MFLRTWSLSSATFHFYCATRMHRADYAMARCPSVCHNSPCLLPFMGRLGSGPHLMDRIGSGVWVSVSFLQKYPPGSVLRCPTAAENGVMTKGVVSGGFGLRLRRITSNPSQTLRRRLVRTTDAAVSTRLDAVLFFTLRDSYGWWHCRPVCSEARYSSRIAFFAYPTCIRRPR